MSVFTVPDMVLAIFPLLVFAPVFEELLFRGTIFRNSESTGELFAIIATGILFGLWHQNLTQIFTASFFGMFLCFLYLRTRSIYPCIIAHCLNNIIAVVRDYLLSEINLPDITVISGDKLILILLLIIHLSIASAAFVAGTVLGIIEFARQTEDVKFKKDTSGVSVGKKLIIYLTSPVTLVTMTYLIVITILNTAKGYYWFLK